MPEETNVTPKATEKEIYFDRARSIINHNRMKTPNTLGKYEKVRMQSVIDEAEASMVRFTGEKFDSEIFLHESLLYVDFVYELRRRGIDVVQVYDGFYMRRGSIEAKDLHGMMRQCAMGYLGDYRRWKGSVEA